MFAIALDEKVPLAEDLQPARFAMNLRGGFDRSGSWSW
jgi:hypothetical protein